MDTETPAEALADAVNLPDEPPRSLYVAVALVSGAALGYEILLIRLLAIVQWHHYSFMVISLALLGFGASGTLLFLFGDAMRSRFRACFMTSGLAFGLSAVGAFLVAQSLPFNPLEVLWTSVPLAWLSALYGVLMVPFLFAGAAIGLSFMRYRDSLSRVYAADLLGAGTGAVAVVALLVAVRPEVALQVVGWMGVTASAVLMWPLATWMGRILMMGASGVLLLGALLIQGVVLTPSPYKGLPRALEVTGAYSGSERSSPLGLVSVVRSPQVPFRYAPGLSLHARGAPAEQIALFTDADAMSVVTRFDGDLAALAYLRDAPSALPYQTLAAPKVLVAGAGGGEEVLRALVHGAQSVLALELNPQIVSIVNDELGEFSGHLYRRDGVDVRIEDLRGFISRTGERFDLIQLSLLDSFGAAAGGLLASNESFPYTVEAFSEYLSRLRPGGLIAFTQWLKWPPRDDAKLFATAIRALREMEVTRPGDRLAWFRTWSTSTILVKNGPWRPAEIAALRAFAESRGFDAVFFPGITPADINRFNRLKEPIFHDVARSLLGGNAAQFFERYKFHIEPATDDQPYFFNFFKWGTLPEVLERRAQGGVALAELGYLIVIAALVQALLASALLILAPLLLRRSRSQRKPRLRLQFLVYFASIGLAFMLLEIACMQRFTLFLNHPIYAVTIVLVAFLLGAGIGSYLVDKVSVTIELTVTCIVILGMLLLLLGPLVLRLAWNWPMGGRSLLAMVLIVPLAVPLGTLFPLGIRRLTTKEESLIAWGWGINGCASVVGAILAIVLAMHFGFSAVVGTALSLYALAAVMTRERGSAPVYEAREG